MAGEQSTNTGAVVLTSASPAETRRLGERLGAQLRAGDVLLLEGDLGVGKTALTQGIGAGLGVRGQINSPTFTLLKEYVGRVPLYHFDLYRIESPDELHGLGFEDYFGGDGVAVVEWADRAEDAPLWPDDYLRIDLRAESAARSERRTLTMTARGRRGEALLSALAPPAASRQPGQRAENVSTTSPASTAGA